MGRPGKCNRESCEHLKTLFLAADSGDTPRSSRELWRAMAADPWLLAELEIRAAACVAAVEAPADWVEEVAHQALLLLADRLERSPTLGVDVERARTTFPAWLGSTLEGLCQNALHYVARLRRPHRPSPDGERRPDVEAARDLAIDLFVALDTLAAPSRLLMVLRLQGHSLCEAARLAGMTRKHARTLYHAACEQLKSALRAYRSANEQ